MGRHLAFVLLVMATVGPADAQWWGEGPGHRVSVTVEVEGRRAPLYPATDADRFYLEARAGARYAVSLTNRTRERVGVVLTVDGLNAISGQRDSGVGRMYVLGPWEETTVRGWRSSMTDVRQFTFVDERASYAARAGKANGRMGWIEVTVFREHRPFVSHPCAHRGSCGDRPVDRTMEPEAREYGEDEDRAARDEGLSEDAAPSSSARESEGKREDKAARGADRYRPAPGAPSAKSFPGTGWGDRAYDPVTVVEFRAEPAAVERLTLRYEYASALRALGILPRRYPGRDRLSDRERGDLGFARPPAW
ncbi:MAG TPA: hypothetical protein VI669_16160 [Vicinamibacteria bacterium]